MSYGDEQAEARRLRSILEDKPGGSMTDPVAPAVDRPIDVKSPAELVALALRVYSMTQDSEFGFAFEEPEQGVLTIFREAGYVLVNADMLAAALAAEVDAVFGPPADGISIANRRGIVAGTMERLAALKGPAR